MKVRITNEHICPLPLVGQEVEVERLRELYPGLEICGDPPGPRSGCRGRPRASRGGGWESGS